MVHFLTLPQTKMVGASMDVLIGLRHHQSAPRQLRESHSILGAKFKNRPFWSSEGGGGGEARNHDRALRRSPEEYQREGEGDKSEVSRKLQSLISSICCNPP